MALWVDEGQRHLIESKPFFEGIIIILRENWNMYNRKKILARTAF